VKAPSKTAALASGAIAAGGLGYLVWSSTGGAREYSVAEIDALEQTSEILSDVFLIEDEYKSMKGPKSHVRGSLLDVDPPELLWVTGYSAVMVDAEGETQLAQEFMCHANLNIDKERHKELFGAKKAANPRLFTLSQGQNSVEFPPGYGIPVASDEALDVGMQVLNLNRDVAVDGTLEVRHKVTITFVRDSDLPRPMNPLFMEAAAGLVSLGSSKAYYNTDEPDAEEHGEGCMVGTDAHTKVSKDRFGNEFSGHWVVKPGREENHTNVTRYMNLPFDTKVHYVAVHLHPFAESLELWDLSEDRSVYKSAVRNSQGKVGLDHVDEYSSSEGFRLYADHEYELISIYNNTSGVDQDAMAVMFMYAEDHEFERPAAL
jgi:hypothetical protein